MKKIGQVVTMNLDALENYGKEWKNVELVITYAANNANKYMPAKEFFERGKPRGYHPGYDDGVSGQGLYDLKRKDTGESLMFSLYDWELE
jgi:hypothetical protein